MNQKIEQLSILAALFIKKSSRSIKKMGLNIHFRATLENLLGRMPISSTDLQEWLEKNKSIFGNKENLVWEGIFSGGPVNNYANFIEANAGNKKIARIYKEQVEPIDMKVSEEAILQPSENIPPLYLFVGTAQEIRPSYEKHLDPLSAQNHFIARAINYLFRLDYDSDIKELSEFISKNKEKIDKLRSQFSEQPKYIGGGVDGVAFSISPSTVLKLFKSPHNFEEAKKALNRLHENPQLAKTEAMIYDVGELGIWKTHPIFYYIIEKMIPISKFNYTVEAGLNIVTKEIAYQIKQNISELKLLKQKINDPNQYDIIKTKTSDKAKEIADVMKITKAPTIKLIEKHIPPLKNTWLQSLIEEMIMKYLTSRTDLHLGNLGLTNYGEFRYFDPAYENWTSEINVPSNTNERTPPA